MRTTIFILTVFLFVNCSTGQEKTISEATKVSIEENPVDKKWNFTFQLLAAVGSLATFGSFIYLFRRDKDKQMQIDKLSNIVTTLSSLKDIENQKLNLSVRPDIQYQTCMTQGSDGEWELGIINVGEKTTLTKFELNSDSLVLHNEHIPHVLEKGESRKIFARTNREIHVKDCQYELKIYHLDKIGNVHISLFKGTGSGAKLTETINCA